MLLQNRIINRDDVSSMFFFSKIIKSYVSVAKYLFVKIIVGSTYEYIWIFRDKFPGNSKGFERVATTEVKRIEDVS